jgi:hypothetical protein
MRRLFALTGLLLVAALASGCATGIVNKPPSDVTETSATVNGIVWTTVGGEVSYWVEYGTSTAYGQETTHRTVDVAEDTPHDVSIPIAGLGGATTWHYRLCAEDAQAGTCSKDATLLTGDSVVGSGTTGGGFDVSFDIDAHSGPLGENPTGIAGLERVRDPFTSLRGSVTCLTVTGPRAVIGVENSLGSEPAAGALFEVFDETPIDTLGVQFLDAVPTVCPAELNLFPNPVVLGDIVVSDAQPVTSTEEQ